MRDIKEKLSYVALDFEDEMNKAKQSTELEKNYEVIFTCALRVMA